MTQILPFTLTGEAQHIVFTAPAVIHRNPKQWVYCTTFSI